MDVDDMFARWRLYLDDRFSEFEQRLESCLTEMDAKIDSILDRMDTDEIERAAIAAQLSQYQTWYPQPSKKSKTNLSI